MNKSPVLRLTHILQSIDHIIDFVDQDEQLQDLRTLQAIFYELVIIGEAARDISPEYQEEFSDIPWKKMIALRNVLAHEYWKIQRDRIFNAIQALPAIRSRIAEMIARYN